MKVRMEFEIVRSNLMSKVPAPSLDQCLGVLLKEEQCSLTQAAMEQKGGRTDLLIVAYATQTRSLDLNKT